MITDNNASRNQQASKLTVARLLAEVDTPLDQMQLPLNEQSPKLEISQPESAMGKANESVQEDFLAVRNSLQTGQLSKLLEEVRSMLYKLQMF